MKMTVSFVKAFISPNIVEDKDWDSSDKTQIPVSKMPSYLKEALVLKYNQINHPQEETSAEKRFQGNGTGK